MTHNYSKPTRKKLRELAGLAYERELSRVQEDDLLVCRAVKLGFLSGYEIANFIGRIVFLFMLLFLDRACVFC